MSARGVIPEAANEWVVALSLSDLPPGASAAVEAFGTTVAVFNVGGRIFAVGNNCPHHGGPLCRGRVSGTHLPSRPYEYHYGREERILVCPWHGREFDIESGRALFDAAVRMKVYEARVEDGQVLLTRRRTRRPS